MGIIFEAIIYDLLFVVFTFLVFLYFQISKKLRYFQNHYAPHVKCGGFLDFNPFGVFRQKSLLNEYDELYKKFEGNKYCGFFSLYNPQILIRDPALIVKITDTDFPHFTDHGVPADPETNWLDRNLFAMSGWDWAAMRNLLIPAFTSEKTKLLVPLIMKCITKSIGKLGEFPVHDCNVMEHSSNLFVDVMGSTAFGVEFNNGEESQFREMATKSCNFSFMQKLKLVLLDISPKILRLFGFQVYEKDVQEFFLNTFSQKLEERVQRGEKRNDLVDLLQQLREKGFIDVRAEESDEVLEERTILGPERTTQEITTELLTAQAFVFFLAGYETLTTALSLLLYLFAKNPEAQRKAREEIQNKSREFGGIDYNSVQSMSYLNACILECLRMYPPVFALTRTCTKDYCLEDGFIVHSGTKLTIPVYSIHRDPSYYPNPDTFQPERFLNGEPATPGSYLPFGYGHRTCIGKRTALASLLLSSACILDRFKIQPGFLSQEVFTFRPQYFITCVEEEIWIKFTKIEDD